MQIVIESDDIKIGTMRRSVAQFFLLVLLIILTGYSGLRAQQDSQSNLLPEIDPQDIEIRSEFTARFPGLRRQPILGFNPSSRVYQIGANRTPFMETQEQVVANLPITDLSRPAAPAYESLHYEPKINAFGRLGIGSFISPEAEFWGYSELSETSYLGGNLDYHSTNGHLEPENSSFRYFDLDGEFSTKVSERVSLKVTGGLQTDFNRMYELDLGETALIQVPVGPKKEYSGYNAGVRLNQTKNSVEGWEAEANIRHYELEMLAGDLSGAANETTFNSSIRKEWAGAHLHETFALNAEARGGSYSSSEFSDEGWLTVQGGAEYQRLFNYSTKVTAAVNVVYTSNEFESKVYPGLRGEIKHWLQDNLTVTGTMQASPKLTTFEQFHHLNRFLIPGLKLQHTYNVQAGGEISFEYLDGSSLYAEISYLDAQNYAFFDKTDFQATPSGQALQGYYTVRYMDATRLKGTAGISHQLLPERFWLNAEAYIQRPKLDGGTNIPYEEEWGLNSGFSLRPIDQLTVEAWADYVGERTTLSSDELGGFFLIGGQIDIQITENIGVYAKLLNLLSQEYEIWDGYVERPLQVYGGMTVKLN